MKRIQYRSVRLGVVSGIMPVIADTVELLSYGMAELPPVNGAN